MKKLLLNTIHKFKKHKIIIIGPNTKQGNAFINFFIKNNITENVICHTYKNTINFKENFYYLYKQIKKNKVDKLYDEFIYSGMRFKFNNLYLKDVDFDNNIICLPEGWKNKIIENKKLFKYFDENLLVKEKYKNNFYCILKLFVENFPGNIIGIYGSKKTQNIINFCKQFFISSSNKNKILYLENEFSYNILNNIDDIDEQSLLIINLNHFNLYSNFNINNNFHLLIHDIDNTEKQKFNRLKHIIHNMPIETNIILNKDHKEIYKTRKNIKSKILLFSKKSKLDNGIFIEKDKKIIINYKSYYKMIDISKTNIKKDEINNLLATISLCFIAGIPIRILEKKINSIFNF